MWCLASEGDASVTSASSSCAGGPISRYSAKPQIYSATPGASTDPGASDAVQSVGSYVPDAAPPYLQQIVQRVVAAEPGGPAVYQSASPAVYQPGQLPRDTTAYRPPPAQSTLLLQHETNPAATHFVLPPPPPPAMSTAYGPPQFLVGQPGPVQSIEVERFGAPPPPPPPPPGSVPYPPMPCVSGINTASGPVSYWMTLN